MCLRPPRLSPADTGLRELHASSLDGQGQSSPTATGTPSSRPECRELGELRRCFQLDSPIGKNSPHGLKVQLTLGYFLLLSWEIVGKWTFLKNEVGFLILFPEALRWGGKPAPSPPAVLRR